MQYIELTDGKEVLVDDEDAPALELWAWSFITKKSGGGYAYRDVKHPTTRKRTRKLMHREIMNAPKGLLVDHIDGNGLNNQRSNLRLVTPTQNKQNQTASRKDKKSGFKGVSWCPSKNSWRVSITVNGVNRTLGYFKDIQLGKEAYNRAALEAFGVYARVNED